MLVGCCVNFLPKEKGAAEEEYAETIKKCGFDYIELPLGQAVMKTDKEFAQMCRRLKDVNLPVYSCNNFFAEELKLVGENVNEKKVESYCRQALPMAEELGCWYAVLGSPWSKNCPAGFSRERAFEQLVEWCKRIGDMAAEHNITVALEPNNREETNMINTFEDAVGLARAVSHPNIKCLQDYYHLRKENDTVESMEQYGKEYLVHAHFARIEKRGFPACAQEDPYYSEFFRALNKIGYRGGISMEGFPESRSTFEEEARTACSLMKELILKEQASGCRE